MACTRAAGERLRGPESKIAMGGSVGAGKIRIDQKVDTPSEDSTTSRRAPRAQGSEGGAADLSAIRGERPGVGSAHEFSRVGSAHVSSREVGRYARGQMAVGGPASYGSGVPTYPLARTHFGATVIGAEKSGGAFLGADSSWRSRRRRSANAHAHTDTSHECKSVHALACTHGPARMHSHARHGHERARRARAQLSPVAIEPSGAQVPIEPVR